MRVTRDVCDRCGTEFGLRGGRTLTVGYHHPASLELCGKCEGEFALWLGKHPLWGTPLEQMLAGLAVGDGYPLQESIDEYRRAHV